MTGYYMYFYELSEKPDSDQYINLIKIEIPPMSFVSIDVSLTSQAVQAMCAADVSRQLQHDETINNTIIDNQEG